MAHQADDLYVAGIQPLTMIEWEGRLSAVVFLQGCAWRCRYCHNRRLTSPTGVKRVPWSEVRDFLTRRQGFLDAVVFSGGEPTMQAALAPAIGEVRELGFAVALHTNGYHPKRLEALLQAKLVDTVSMDVKAPFDRYAEITGSTESGRAARESVEAIIRSGIPHEFRTTWHPALFDADAVLGIGETLAAMGARVYFVQYFRAEGCEDDALANSAALPAILPPAMQERLGGLFERFGVRGITDDLLSS